MSNWLDRSGYITLFAFAAGAAVAVIVLLVILFTRGGDDDEPQVLPPTSTAIIVPATSTAAPVTTATATALPPATATASFSTADDAVASFVQDGLGGVYIGECPPSVPSGDNTLEGICSIELYRSTELATFNIGPFGSEALGEAVVIPDVDGRWTLVFLNFPPLDAQLTIGLDAMVFQAEDCLRFRPQPVVDLEPASCQIDGTSGKLVDGPVEADGLTWWRLEGLGWASDSFLAPVE